jgi:hypothetical protein
MHDLGESEYGPHIERDRCFSRHHGSLHWGDMAGKCLRHKQISTAEVFRTKFSMLPDLPGFIAGAHAYLAIPKPSQIACSARSARLLRLSFRSPRIFAHTLSALLASGENEQFTLIEE